MDSLAIHIPTLLSHEGGKHPFFCTRDTSLYGCILLESEICGFRSLGAFRIDMVGAVGVCVIEMLLALLAIWCEYRRVASVGFCLMLTFFVYLTGVNLFSPTIMGSIESCGCFGELIHFSPLASFIKSVVLWLLSLVLLFCTFKSNTPWNVGKLFKDMYLYICIASSLVLPLYSLCFFETSGHTMYVFGFIVVCIMLAACICVKLRSMSNEEYTG